MPARISPTAPQRSCTPAMPDASPADMAVLYREHHGWLRGWLGRRTGGDGHQAADLAQDTFLRLLRTPPPDPLREPRAFLRCIAQGLLVSHWRRRDLETAYAQALALQPEGRAPSAEQQAMALEALAEVDAMLARLPAKARTAFLMAQLEDRGQAEIAAALGVSERMVRKYLQQAMLQCLLLARQGTAS